MLICRVKNDLDSPIYRVAMRFNICTIMIGTGVEQFSSETFREIDKGLAGLQAERRRLSKNKEVPEDAPLLLNLQVPSFNFFAIDVMLRSGFLQKGVTGIADYMYRLLDALYKYVAEEEDDYVPDLSVASKEDEAKMYHPLVNVLTYSGDVGLVIDPEAKFLSSSKLKDFDVLSAKDSVLWVNKAVVLAKW